MFNWLIHLFGGKTKKEYEQVQKDLFIMDEKYDKLCNSYWDLEDQLKSYASIDFISSGEYSFSIKTNSPYSILVKKGQKLTITGFDKDGNLLDKIYCEEK